MSIVVGIDIGSHKVCTLVGEGLPGGGLRIHGMGHAPAEGIRRGEVVHVEDAAGAIAASVERAERVAGVAVESAVVGMTGLHLAAEANQASVPLGRVARPVDEADIAGIHETAGALPLAPGRELLHVLPRHYRLDEGAAVVSPLGMEGQRLEASVQVLTASATALANLRRCLQLAEVRPAALVYSTLAAAEAALTADERALGCCVVDLGASVTGLACYHEGALVHSATLPIGSRHMTNDLAVLLQTPLEQAERIKATHGHVLPELDDEAVEIDVVPFGEADSRRTTRHHVSEVLAARADELAGLVEDALEEAGLTDRLPAGAVLVGGGSELNGMARRLSASWQTPVRIGRCQQVLGLGEAAQGPAYAAVVGLLHWHARGVVDAAGTAPAQARTNGSGGGIGRALGWAKTAFLPKENRDGP